MKIKSYDPVTQEVVFRPVTDVWQTTVPVENQRHVVFENGAEVRCSKDHPIMVLENSSVIQKFPDDLTSNDVIIVDGLPTKLVSVEQDQQPENYIDITVEDTEMFFAQTSPESDMILTHNCSQGGVRGGAATLYYPIWHLEVEDMLVLKNNKGTEDNRVRHMDYGVQFNKLMYERLLSGGDITLFSPSDVPGLYESFFNDQDRFRELYETAERNTRLRKRTVKALDLFSAFVQERKDTGRIYLMNVDHANTHGSFDEQQYPVRMSNLCCEITLPTRPLDDFRDGTIKRKIKIKREYLDQYLEFKKREAVLPQNKRRDS